METTTLSKTSTQLSFKCPRCAKKGVSIVKEAPFGKHTFATLSCGHAIIKSQLQVEANEEAKVDWTKFEDGRTLFPFQAITKDNIIKANGRCLLALDMGLGKTLCAISATRQLYDEMRDILVITKSGLMLQWFEEYFKACGIKYSPAIIENSNQKPLVGFINIVSYDLLRRMDTSEWKFKTVILDECQHIKNPTSKRTEQVRLICANAQYIIGTSGTPFKNNIDEYFTILNILRPDKHGNRNEFIRRWCNVRKAGNTYKIEGLRDPEAFLRYNQDFVFRFEREEVLPDLPKIFRHFRYVELDDLVKGAYEKEFKEFTAFYDRITEGGTKGASFNDYSNILAFFAKMRHLAGLAKVNATIEYTQEFLEQTERKLTLAVHHQDVHQILINKLAALGIKTLNLKAGLSPTERFDLVKLFQSDDSIRVLTASTLAGSEGTDGLQNVCSDVVLVERQWNPANEEQLEARFPRPKGKDAKINVSIVSALYIVAINTIDEYLAEIVEKKRQYVKEGLDGSCDVKWDESSIIKDLAEILMSKGKKKWGAK